MDPEAWTVRYQRTTARVAETDRIPKQVGVGQGSTSRRAGTAALHAPDRCRRADTRVAETAPTWHGATPD